MEIFYQGQMEWTSDNNGCRLNTTTTDSTLMSYFLFAMMPKGGRDLIGETNYWIVWGYAVSKGRWKGHVAVLIVQQYFTNICLFVFLIYASKQI